jgi:hypothetical protein
VVATVLGSFPEPYHRISTGTLFNALRRDLPGTLDAGAVDCLLVRHHGINGRLYGNDLLT